MTFREFIIESSDIILLKVEPYLPFNIAIEFNSIDYDKYINEWHGDKQYEKIKLTEIHNLGDPTKSKSSLIISQIIKFLQGKGYIKPSNDSYFDLTEIGRIAQRKGGHNQYLKYLELEDNLKQQMIDVNQSVLETNRITKENIRTQKKVSFSTLIIAVLSTLFIAITTWKSYNDKASDTTNMRLQSIKEELQYNRRKTDSILSYLIEKGYLKVVNKSTDTLHKRRGTK